MWGAPILSCNPLLLLERGPEVDPRDREGKWGLKSCQLSFSKSLFAGVLKTGVNSRKKCLLLHGAVREGQGMFSRADCACTTSLVAARCWSGACGL